VQARLLFGFKILEVSIMPDSIVSLIEVTKRYKGKEVVRGVNLEIEKGDFLTILGPSGAGKTTVLKMIAGFEKTSDGHINLNGENITRRPTYKRNIGMLFQNYALFPHMTVFENIAFPLKIRKMKKDEIEKKVLEILKKVKLEGYEGRLPKELSGGQQQRVALARALVFDPPILLLDEPMAALDKQLKKHMQLEIKQIHEELGITTISVTHDQEEALTMATKVCVMKDGKVVQVAKPEEIYEKPNCSFVANFLGEANLLEGKVQRVEADKVLVKIQNGDELLLNKNSIFRATDQNVKILIRPEKFKIIKEDNFKGVKFNGKVEQIVYTGEAIKANIILSFGAEVKVKVLSTSGVSLKAGDTVNIGAELDDVVIVENY
jgi:spermidine/putrescine ABC transporter ATP-binding subunit